MTALGSSGVASNLTTTTATIANGETLSGEVAFGGLRLFSLDIPVMTGASLTFEVYSEELSAWLPKYDDAGSVYSVVCGDPARQVSLDPSAFASVEKIRITSSASEASERTIGIISRGV